VIEHQTSIIVRYGDTDQITVETRLTTGNKFKLELKYRILNQDQKLVAKANTALVFVERKSGKLIPGFHKYLDPLTLKEEAIS
jgi:acyl-CoA thioesterase FadM